MTFDVPSLGGPSATGLTLATWRRRRTELLSLFAREVYGTTPPGGGTTAVTVASQRPGTLDGLATRIELTVTVAGPRGERPLHVLLHTPHSPGGAGVPVFVGLNFRGNHAMTADPGVRISDAGLETPPAARGAEAGRWPCRTILKRGYAVATAHYADLEIDAPGRRERGVRGLFPRPDPAAGPDAEGTWGAIGAWAWGLSRLVDGVADVPGIDSAAVIAVGHSRLGKAALWAAAQDPRIGAVISNDSGCGGASLYRHHAGEDVRAITTAFPHWFAPSFARFSGAEESLPVDAHQLLALVAPRPTYVASAAEDAWADPRGEYLSTVLASPVFAALGAAGILLPDGVALGADVPAAVAEALPPPPLGERVGGALGYHVRPGGHDLRADDWTHFLDFADEHVRRDAAPART